jgi:hypothetical protein
VEEELDALRTQSASRLDQVPRKIRKISCLHPPDHFCNMSRSFVSFLPPNLFRAARTEADSQ